MKKLIFFLLFVIVLVSIPDVKSFYFNCQGYKLGLNFCYEVNYEVQSCAENICYSKTGLIKEGEEVIYWPKIFVTGFAYSNENRTFYFNETYHPGDLLIIYYFVYPSGENSERRIVFISDPEVNLEGFQNGSKAMVSSQNSIGGISVPTDHPGVIELKSVIAPIGTLNNLSGIDNSFFETRKIHILSYSEVLNEKISRSSLYVAILGLIIALIVVFVPFYKDKQRQISLLEALYSELDAISSKKGEIEVLDKKIPTKGNLQWIKELFGWELRPAHGIWKLSTQDYITGLDRKIKGKTTRPLKKVLILISQKIELIENYLIQYASVTRKDDAIKEAIMKVINEVTELVDITKKLLEKDFGIRKTEN